MARLDRLAAVKVVAQLGAAIGRTFPYALIDAVAQLDTVTLQGALAQLVEAEVVAQRGLPPQATYTFKHALIQDAAYQSLLRSTRQQYHQRIAQVLEGQFPEMVEEQPALLAHHAVEGAVWDKAVTYCQQAAAKAYDRAAFREAVAYFEQALQALAHLPETRDTREQAIDLRLALRSALRPLGDFGRILAALRQAEALAEALADPCRLGQVSGFLSIDFTRMGAYDQAIAAAQRSLALATASGDVVMHALANQNLGISYLSQGDYRQAIDCFRQTVAALDGVRRRERFGQFLFPAVQSYAFLAVCHADLGAFAEGRALGEEGLRIAEAVDHPGSLMFASGGIGLLFLCQGDLPRALPLLERAVDICQKADLPAFFPRVAMALGAAYTLSGRVADAVPLLTRAMEQLTVMERGGDQASASLSLGEMQVSAGRLEEAQALAEQALALARAHQRRGTQAYALHLLGDIAARREPPESDQAEGHYRQALALADELGMRPLQAHCHRGLVTLYAATGQRELARAELATAIALYRTMEMTFWLPETEAALAQVERQ
jgi:tetratricopeptide (TPR) repeat protein